MTPEKILEAVIEFFVSISGIMTIGILSVAAGSMLGIAIIYAASDLTSSSERIWCFSKTGSFLNGFLGLVLFSLGCVVCYMCTWLLFMIMQFKLQFPTGAKDLSLTILFGVVFVPFAIYRHRN